MRIETDRNLSSSVCQASSGIMKRLWLCCLPLLAIVAWMLWLLPVPKNAVALSILGHTNDATGVPVVIFQATSCSTIPLCVIWAHCQHYESHDPEQRGDFTLLPGRSALTFACSAPDYSGTSSWWVFVLYKRPPSTFAARVDKLLWKLGLRMEVNKWRSKVSPELPMPKS
jgi:hypothetical protein